VGRNLKISLLVIMGGGVMSKLKEMVGRYFEKTRK
jgi:hypothetical protein